MYIKKYGDFITEGLIKSYTKDDVNKYLTKLGLKGKDDYIFSDNDRLKIYLKINHKSKYKHLIQTLENLYGWLLVGFQDDFYNPIQSKELETLVNDIEYNLAETEKDNGEDGDYIDFGTLYFEPKYSTEIEEKNLPNIAYHVTDKKHLPKIKKQGLSPRHKDKLTKHPDRIYLFIDKKNVKGLLDNPNFEIDDPLLLTIDISDFKKDNKFYIDPNLNEGGVYVLQNIHPDLIINIDKIK